MMQRRLALTALALALTGLSFVPAVAQEAELQFKQLKPLKPSGDIVAPFFDGWYPNPDGTYTLSFGYMNRNTREIVDIPVGPNNVIEPAEFDGMQPTHFEPVNYGGFDARRERGAFTITIPAELADTDVVWTITHAGETYSVPGRVTSPAYELSYSPMTAGSEPPRMAFAESGPFSVGRAGEFYEETLTTTVGAPVTLSVWAEDNGVREETFPVEVVWWHHQGPGEVVFETESTELESLGEATTTATFSGPGEYVIRARADNFGASDSSFGNQCCWSNLYFRVNVTE
ncbi:MAG: hypothetical protein GEU90_02245 [Gemmatimonas sp.]|nr:hypothetical protein [Gemmatimonas sp.]